MVTTVRRFAHHRLFIIIALALLGVVIVAPRVSGQDVQTRTFDVSVETSAIAPAVGHAGDQGLPERGDVFSGQGSVYAGGDAGGTRIGTFYYMSVGTADLANFDTASNHLYAMGQFEIWGQGSLNVTGTVTLTGTSYLAIVGGTGAFATASGQCTLVTGDVDAWSCDVQ